MFPPEWVRFELQLFAALGGALFVGWFSAHLSQRKIDAHNAQ
jgi:hypothetical protein